MPWCSATRDSPNGSPTVNRSPPGAVKRASGIIGTASGNRCTCTAAELPAAQQQGPVVAGQRHARPPRRRPRHSPPTTNKKATPQGGFLISSACGDHDHAAWTGVLWSKECFTWHRPIFSGGYPPNIVAAAAFHNRVRDGSEWFHCAMDTRIELTFANPLFIHPQE